MKAFKVSCGCAGKETIAVVCAGTSFEIGSKGELKIIGEEDKAIRAFHANYWLSIEEQVT